MLNDAKRMLISEMVLVCELTLEETEELVAESVEFNPNLDLDEDEENEDETDEDETDEEENEEVLEKE